MIEGRDAANTCAIGEHKRIEVTCLDCVEALRARVEELEADNKELEGALKLEQEGHQTSVEEFNEINSKIPLLEKVAEAARDHSRDMTNEVKLRILTYALRALDAGKEEK